MRILSQEGMIDVPYEQCGFIVFFDELFSGNWDINASIGGNKTYKMAEYSNESKARKAMEMLRKAYSPLLVVKDLGDEFEIDIKPNDLRVSIPEPLNRNNFYFQFPQDSEVEV